MPVFSLPGKYGIGTLGKEARNFVDLLCDTGNKVWQILPMGPTGFGDSPYQSFSAFAGNPYFVDLEALAEEKLLDLEELEDSNEYDFGELPERISYGKLYRSKIKALRKAYANYRKEGHTVSDILETLHIETREYCLFMAIKDSLNGASWDVWPKELRDHEAEEIRKFETAHMEEIGFYAFVQMKFNEQWEQLHRYAEIRGIEIIGDIPIYCAVDSADAWFHRELFQFDEEAHPLKIAGVPPDAFSATGQLWGNPLYDWDYHEKNGFRWWCERMEYCLSKYDYLRVDHFRGFESYYAVPFGEETAENGTWMPGPGMKLFRTLEEKFGTLQLPIIAEDLGIITKEVRTLMKETGFPGMKICQFSFDSGCENAYLPHNFTTPNCIAYTGTHDNDTLKHWFETLPDHVREYIYQYLSRSHNDWNAMPDLLIKSVMGTIADTVIVPVADYLGLGAEGRINQPGTTGANWQWRMKENAFTEQRKHEIARIIGTYGRYQTANEKPEEHPVDKSDDDLSTLEEVSGSTEEPSESCECKEEKAERTSGTKEESIRKNDNEILKKA